MFEIIYFSVTVNWTSLCCGQNKILEYVILGFGKPWQTFFTKCNQTTNVLLEKIINNWIAGNSDG